MVAYAALAFPLVTVRARDAPLMFAAAVVFGGAIEFLQPLFGRYAEWHDFFANLAGATIGIFIGLCLKQFVPKVCCLPQRETENGGSAFVTFGRTINLYSEYRRRIR